MHGVFSNNKMIEKAIL